jgi:YaiO family outer membrane protein
MLLSLATVLILATGPQSQPDVRVRAEQLARAGRTVEALELFRQVVAQNPGDIEARLWVARLDLRIGNVDNAEATCRSILREHPGDVDAKIGLGNALMRKGASDEALTILLEAEGDAGENADFFAALARAYRRIGDDRRALQYFTRAKALAADDPDVASGYEAVVTVYGHSVIFEGFGQHYETGVTSSSGLLMTTIRVHPRVHLTARARVQERAGTTDALGGGGVLWRASRTVTILAGAAGGPGNTILPKTDVVGEFVKYAGVFEFGGNVRRILFATTDVVVASPVFAWDTDRWRFDTRYSFSRSHFSGTGETSGDHSIMFRETWRGWRRAALNATFARGVESFEDLTVDQVRGQGTTTMAAGVRFTLPSVTAITTTWEHQWRSNVSAFDRLTVAFVQSFP